MRITSKYILREHLGPLSFALGALTSLLLLNYIARKFGDLVGRGLPWKAIAEFFVLSVPFTVAMTLPMAVLVSVLYAFSRLASENEVTAFKASGLSMSRLLSPVLWAASVLAVGMVLFNDQVLPRANHTLSQLQQDIARTSPTFALKERVLNEIAEGVLLRATTVDTRRNTMRDVTIYDMSQQSPRTIRADSGALGLMPNGKDLQITLYTGTIEQLGEGRPEQLQRTNYTTQLVRFADVIKTFDQSKPGSNEYKSDREMSICELQRAYTTSRQEYFRAKLDYDIAIAQAKNRPLPKPPKPKKVFLGLGRLYCQGLDAVSHLGVRAAKAQEPVKQDTTTKRDTVAKPPVPPPSVPQSSVPQSSVPQSTVPQSTVPGLRADTSAAVAGAAAAPPTTTPIAPPPPVVNPTPPATNPAPAPAPSSGTFNATSALDLSKLRATEALGTMNGYDVEIHKKFALAVACIVFVLLGAPIALRFPRGGVGLVIGVSLFVFAAYYSCLIAGEELSNRGMLPPWIAMWAANVIFGGIGLPLAWRMGRESGSARGGGLAEAIDNLRYRLRRAA